MGAHSILPLAGIWICPHHPESDNDDVCVCSKGRYVLLKDAINAIRDIYKRKNIQGEKIERSS